MKVAKIPADISGYYRPAQCPHAFVSLLRITKKGKWDGNRPPPQIHAIEYEVPNDVIVARRLIYTSSRGKAWILAKIGYPYYRARSSERSQNSCSMKTVLNTIIWILHPTSSHFQYSAYRGTCSQPWTTRLEFGIGFSSVLSWFARVKLWRPAGLSGWYIAQTYPALVKRGVSWLGGTSDSFICAASLVRSKCCRHVLDNQGHMYNNG